MLRLAKPYFNWTNILFFTLLPLIAFVGTALLCIFSHVAWQTWLLTAIMMVLTGLAITAGYHRLLSHKTYKATWPVRFILLLLGAAAFEGSALEWCCDHRNHHRYTDTEKDPYGINKGFWYAHIGWLFHLDAQNYDFSNVTDLNKDPLVMLQHKYYLWIAIFMGFILPMGIAACWGDPLGGLIIAAALRMTINHHATFAINSVSHYFGERTYSDHQLSARDNWFTALLTYGEGFHNFHHRFPMDYRNGIRAYHYDPTKWLIKALSWLGLAYDLRQVSEYSLIRYRVQMEEKHTIDKLHQIQEPVLNHFKARVIAIRDNLNHVLARVEELEQEYSLFRKQKFRELTEKVSEYQQHLEHYQARLRTARQELKTYLLDWTRVLVDCKQIS